MDSVSLLIELLATADMLSGSVVKDQEHYTTGGIGATPIYRGLTPPVIAVVPFTGDRCVTRQLDGRFPPAMKFQIRIPAFSRAVRVAGCWLSADARALEIPAFMHGIVEEHAR